MKTFEENPELKLALDYVEYTNKNIFLTGKAGTGKTTFLHNLKKSSPKRMAVVAPTGVAAINAGGVTIHSFFQLPFGPHIPEHLQKGSSFNPGAQQNAANNKKFNREKIKLIQSLDLLVIDEISMVRADMLDAIDEVLRRYKNHYQPFGGVQLLMIGDLHQLSPVIKDDEWSMLKEYYDTVYFFSSKALQKTEPISIELKHIYRQSDQYFIKMLNSIRDNNIDYDLLNELNERYIPDFKPGDEEGYITLTTHNNSAQTINQTKLSELKLGSSYFNADIKDDFPSYAYPTEVTLELKVNAQVMFVKNDSSRDKNYYNGKIGRVTKIEGKDIYVKCDSDLGEILVGQEEWQNIKYVLNQNTKEIEEQVLGTFKQYPLKLAWAITIHKSQGLTFEKAIIDANAAFAHGQVYVALSRCKTFEGMVLSTPIIGNSIKTDEVVAEFTKDIHRNLPNAGDLNESKTRFQQLLLADLFDFSAIEKDIRYFNKLIEGNSNILHGNLEPEIKLLNDAYTKDIHLVNEKFKVQMGQLLGDESLPETNMELQDRVKKASAYFAHKLDVDFYEKTKEIIIDSDNKLVKESVYEGLEDFQRNVFVKIQCFKKMMFGFVSSDYMHAKANAEIDFKPNIKSQVLSKVYVPKSMQHGELYISLKQWRDEMASDKDIDPYMILAQKVLIEIVSKLPVTETELMAIKGLGKKKISQFGSSIITIIKDYCIDHKIEKTFQESVMDMPTEKQEESPKKKQTAGDSMQQTYELFSKGYSMEQIAMQRSMSPSTIATHLADLISMGQVKIEDLVSEENVVLIAKVFKASPDKTLTEIKGILGDTFSYNELRYVKNHLIALGELEGVA
ncbi:MAG: helix-turn-helix domain-containing protein [bacterium]|nr:helix-turn-helix domain-containing protein [bacterium]